MGLILKDRFTPYRDPRFYCGPGPGVAAFPNGEWVVTFRRVPSWLSEGHAGHWHPATESCLTRSTDSGRTWSTPQVFLAGYQCPCLARLTDGTLVHHTHRMELVEQGLYERVTGGSERAGARPHPWPSLHAGAATWRSADRGMTWDEPVYLAGAPATARLHPQLPEPVAVRGNVLETSTGRLLVSAYSVGKPNVAHLYESPDRGGSWSWVAAIAADANETCLYETATGELLAFVRRHGDATFLNVARSTDDGRTWGELQPVCRGYPACAQRLGDGRGVLVYGYRFAEGYGLRARLLSRTGEAEEPELIIRDDGAVADLGYPDADVLPDGQVVVVYYTNSKADTAAAPREDPARVPRYVEGCVLSLG